MRLGRRVGINTEEIPSEVLSLLNTLVFFVFLKRHYLIAILELLSDLNV